MSHQMTKEGFQDFTDKLITDIRAIQIAETNTYAINAREKLIKMIKIWPDIQGMGIIGILSLGNKIKKELNFGPKEHCPHFVSDAILQMASLLKTALTKFTTDTSPTLDAMVGNYWGSGAVKNQIKYAFKEMINILNFRIALHKSLEGDNLPFDGTRLIEFYSWLSKYNTQLKKLGGNPETQNLLTNINEKYGYTLKIFNKTEKLVEQVKSDKEIHTDAFLKAIQKFYLYLNKPENQNSEMLSIVLQCVKVDFKAEQIPEKIYSKHLNHFLPIFEEFYNKAPTQVLTQTEANKPQVEAFKEDYFVNTTKYSWPFGVAIKIGTESCRVSAFDAQIFKIVSSDKQLETIKKDVLNAFDTHEVEASFFTRLKNYIFGISTEEKRKNDRILDFCRPKEPELQLPPQSTEEAINETAVENAKTWKETFSAVPSQIGSGLWSVGAFIGSTIASPFRGAYNWLTGPTIEADFLMAATVVQTAADVATQPIAAPKTSKPTPRSTSPGKGQVASILRHHVPDNEVIPRHQHTMQI